MKFGTVSAQLVALVAAAERLVIATLMAAITLLTLAQVIWRYILEMPIQWSEEVARYCFVWVTFLGAAALMRLPESHPAIDTLHQSVGPGLQKALRIVSQLVVIAGSLAIAAGGLRMVQLQWYQLSASLEVPMAWIYSAMFAGPVIGIFWILWCARYGSVADEP
jgi:TRAP-type C4-dicarboxylate transport system permease small subunit